MERQGVVRRQQAKWTKRNEEKWGLLVRGRECCKKEYINRTNLRPALHPPLPSKASEQGIGWCTCQDVEGRNHQRQPLCNDLVLGVVSFHPLGIVQGGRQWWRRFVSSRHHHHLVRSPVTARSCWEGNRICTPFIITIIAATTWWAL